jgi:hypothetical protein
MKENKKNYYEELGQEAWNEMNGFFEQWKNKWEGKNLKIDGIINFTFFNPNTLDVCHSEWRSNINSLEMFNVYHEDVIKEIVVHEHSVESS